MKPVTFRGFALNADGLTSRFDHSFQRPALSPILVKRQGGRPLATGVELDEWQLPNLGMLVDGNAADFDALRQALLQAFDTESGPGALVVTDDDGTNERYLYVTCRELTQKSGETGDGFVASLVATDDVFWRSTISSSASTTMDAATKTFSITNTGDVDAYPIIGLNESVSISGSGYWRYRRFVPIKWLGDAARNYPYELTDGAGLNTSALAGAGKVNSGLPSTLNVIIDGRFVDRWYAGSSGSAGGFNSTTTRIWANFDFAAGLSVPLSGVSGGVIYANGDISAFPSEGILQIDSELFTYTGRDFYRQAFTGIMSAAYGSSPGSHSYGAAVHWIQHEAWIVYNATAYAAPTDDTTKPILDLLASSNSKWVWANFASQTQPNRSGQWTPQSGGTGETFTGYQHGAATDPNQVMGIARPGPGSLLAGNYSWWRFYSPSGIDTLDWTGHSKREFGFIQLQISADGASWEGVGNAYDAAVDGTWASFSDIMPGLTTAWRYVQIVPWNAAGGAYDVESQVTDFELTFQSTLRPTSTMQPEQNNYQMSILIENLTTGESVRVSLLPGLQHTAETVVLDNESRRVIILPGSRNVYQSAVRNTLRPRLMRLVPGVNSMRVSETYYAGNSIAFSFIRRWYL